MEKEKMGIIESTYFMKTIVFAVLTVLAAAGVVITILMNPDSYVFLIAISLVLVFMIGMEIVNLKTFLSVKKIRGVYLYGKVTAQNINHGGLLSSATMSLSYTYTDEQGLVHNDRSQSCFYAADKPLYPVGSTVFLRFDKTTGKSVIMSVYK